MAKRAWGERCGKRSGERCVEGWRGVAGHHAGSHLCRGPGAGQGGTTPKNAPECGPCCPCRTARSARVGVCAGSLRARGRERWRAVGVATAGSEWAPWASRWCEAPAQRGESCMGGLLACDAGCAMCGFALAGSRSDAPLARAGGRAGLAGVRWAAFGRGGRGWGWGACARRAVVRTRLGSVSRILLQGLRGCMRQAAWWPPGPALDRLVRGVREPVCDAACGCSLTCRRRRPNGPGRSGALIA